MMLSQNFTMEEFLASQAATRQNIANIPPPDVVPNLWALAAHLEPVRALLGHPLIISSGYRSPKLNAAVGGARDSAHMKGCAADFICPQYGTPYQVASKILGSGIKFDQLIMEGTWVHISFDQQMRQQPLTAIQGGYKQGIAAR